MLSLLENLASHFSPMMAQHNVNTIFEFVILDNLYFQIHLFQLLLIIVVFVLVVAFFLLFWVIFLWPWNENVIVVLPIDFLSVSAAFETCSLSLFCERVRAIVEWGLVGLFFSLMGASLCFFSSLESPL